MIGGRHSNGFLHGSIDSLDGTITGDRVSYVYPDMQTVLLGRFEDRIMRDAQESNIEAISMDQNGLWKVTTYFPPKSKSAHFYYEPPSNITFGSGPKGVIDPYERRLLISEATTDTVCAAKKKGIFAGRDIVSGTLISSFGGFVFNRDHGELEIFEKSCSMNTTKINDDSMDCKNHALDLSSRNAQINIPLEFDKSELVTDEVGLGGVMVPLIPSLGHKVYLNTYFAVFMIKLAALTIENIPNLLFI